MFGEDSFLGLKRDVTARSTNITNLAILDLDLFKETLLKYPNDYEQFCFLRDKIIFINYTTNYGGC